MIELVVSFILAAGTITGLVLLQRTVKRFEDTIEDTKTEFLEFYAREKEDFVKNIPTLISTFSNEMFGKVRGMVAGQASGMARLDQGLAKAAVDDVVAGQNPLLGLAMEQFPSVKRYLVKNPQALPGVLQLLNSFLGGAQRGQGLKAGATEIMERLKKSYG